MVSLPNPGSSQRLLTRGFEEVRLSKQPHLGPRQCSALLSSSSNWTMCEPRAWQHVFEHEWRKILDSGQSKKHLGHSQQLLWVPGPPARVYWHWCSDTARNQKTQWINFQSRLNRSMEFEAQWNGLKSRSVDCCVDGWTSSGRPVRGRIQRYASVLSGVYFLLLSPDNSLFAAIAWLLCANGVYWSGNLEASCGRHGVIQRPSSRPASTLTSGKI